MRTKYVKLTYSQKTKRLTYSKVTVIPGGQLVKEELAKAILDEMPKRLSLKPYKVCVNFNGSKHYEVTVVK